jgi:hypothetical protein
MIEDGYAVITLKGSAVWRLKCGLMEELGSSMLRFNPPDILPDYKRLVEKLHTMTEWKEIVRDNMDVLRFVVGPNLRRQRKPYMRIARPGVSSDPVQIHRDTHYGATPHEWVLWVPLTDAVGGSELCILPGSHTKPDEFYPWVQERSPDVERGSVKHWLGYMYAPKRMSKEVEDQCVPVPCRVGEALLFNAACVHGAKGNSSGHTRFSIDMRLVDASKPIQQHGIHGDVYEEAA